MKFAIPAVLELARELIACPSITPHDSGCQDILAQHLKHAGFHIKRLRYNDVENMWAKRGTDEPLFVWAGHTDVVPAGPLEEWSSPPFHPTVRKEYLYGRGAADMKGNIAAMVCATLQFIRDYPKHQGSIAFLITSDEEGVGTHGTKKVVEHLIKQNEKLTWCVVGEPSSEKQVGDTIKIGRRGSLSGSLKIFGKQGHIAYPQLAENPIHNSLAVLKELTDIQWDNGNDMFPPTSFQISNIHAGTGASNVIPGHIDVLFNLRYSPEATSEQLQHRIEEILNRHKCRYEIKWNHSGLPFQTTPGKLLSASQQAIEAVTKLKAKLSTTGGTSDGRFIALTGCQVVEMGLCNDTIHQIDERVRVKDLEQLVSIYYYLLRILLI
jgi:succinyl-diaminopimelate desuccinylase